MSESDLDDALQDLDLSDSEGEGGEGEDVSLDPELQAALDAETGGDPVPEDGEDMTVGDDFAAALGDASEGEGDGSVDLDSAFGETPAAAASAPAISDPLAAAKALGMADDSVNLDFLLDIKLHVTFEVGRSKMLITDLLTLGQGSVVELHRLVGDELDLFVNGKLVAKGEVVVVNEKFGCRISSIVPPEDRVKHMGSV